MNHESAPSHFGSPVGCVAVFFGSRSNEFNVAPRRSLKTSLLLALLQNRFEEILVLSGENDLALLIEDGDSGGDEAILPFPRKIDDLQCGVESISSMNLFEKFARQFSKGNKDFADVMWKECRARSSKSKYLKPMNHRRRVPVPCSPYRVVVDGVIVGRNSLKGRCMRISQCAAGRSKYISDLEIFKSLGRH